MVIPLLIENLLKKYFLDFFPYFEKIFLPLKNRSPFGFPLIKGSNLIKLTPKPKFCQ